MSTKQADAAAAVQREKVKLIAEHTHGGTKHPVGAEIEVTAIEKEWLIRHERIAGPDAKTSAAAPVKE
ncbi:hypothetical protein HNP29_002629 [Pseudomonas alcaligenes]|nr:hypothetical protein [Pseudomonas alcaligenes]